MSELAVLFETDIPAGRGKLKENCANLRNVASFCDENYQNAANKAEALVATKQYVNQSLASVAYQINTLATSMMKMLDLQGEQMDGLESSINHLTQNVNIHKEKVARREIGLLTTSKSCAHTHKIVAPENPETPHKNVSRSNPIDYSLLDGIGHGLWVKGSPKPALSPSSSSSSSPSSLTMKKRSESVSSGPPTPTDSPFPVFQPGPDILGPPPKSPTDSDLYATVRKTAPDIVSSPRSIKKYKTKAAPTDVFSACPPAPPPPLALSGAPAAGPAPPPSAGPGTPSGPNPPPAPPPPPLPGGNVNTNETPAPAAHDLDLMPPPPPPDMQVPPQDMAGYPPVSAQPISYPANLGLTEEEMPAPPEFMQPSDVDSSAPAEYIEKVIAIYAYQKILEDELTIQEDDILYVLEKNPNGWYEGVLNGTKGLFPGNYVQPVP